MVTDSALWQLKKVAGFSQMFESSISCDLGLCGKKTCNWVLSIVQVYFSMGLDRSLENIYFNKLVNAQSRLWVDFNIFVPLRKAVYSFLPSLSSTTIIPSIQHVTLRKSLLLSSYKQNLRNFHFCKSSILWTDAKKQLVNHYFGMPIFV